MFFYTCIHQLRMLVCWLYYWQKSVVVLTNGTGVVTSVAKYSLMMSMYYLSWDIPLRIVKTTTYFYSIYFTMFWTRKYSIIIYTDYTQTTQPQSGIDLTNNPAYEVCQQRTNLSQSGIDLTSNPAYEVCQQKTNLSRKNLSEQDTGFNMDNNPLYMIVKEQK